MKNDRHLIDTQAEAATIGGMLEQPDTIDKIRKRLKSHEVMTVREHRMMLEEIFTLHDSGKRVTPEILAARLKERTGKDGWRLLVANVLEQASGRPEDDAETVLERYRRRSALDGINAHAKRIAAGEDSDVIIGSLHEAMANVIAGNLDRTSRVDDLTDHAVEELTRMAKGETSDLVMPTGFADIDKIINGGFRKGQQIVLAAETSGGKSAMALQIAEHVAIHCHRPVLYVSLEMTKLELVARMLQGMSGVAVAHGQPLTPEQDRAIAAAQNKARTAPFVICETPGIGLPELRAEIRAMSVTGGCDLVVVDYLGQMTPPRPKERDDIRIGDLSTGLKQIAIEFNVATLVLAQYSYGHEGKHRGFGKHPANDHLKSSSTVQHDADIILHLHRDEMYITPRHNQWEEVQGKALALIKKHRNGRTGTAELRFTNGRFHSLDRYHSEEIPF